MTELYKDWITHHSRRRPDEVALADADTGHEVSWRELDNRVGRAARVLRDHGIDRGDRVALAAENDTRIFELQFACQRIGVILVPLNWRLTAPELRQQLAESEPGLLVHDQAWGPLAAELSADARWPVLAWGDADTSYERSLAGVADPVAGGELDPDAVVQIMYTSGTTGAPKGVLCTNRTLVTHAQNLAHTSSFRAGGHHLNVVPLFHAGGLNVFSNPMLFWGGRVTTVHRFDPARTLELLTDPDLGVTHLCAVLQMHEWLTALPQFSTAAFPTLRTVLYGGWGPSAAAIYQAWSERGIWVQLAYGASELGPLVSILTEPDPAAARRGTSGSIVPHTAVHLVDAAGAEVPEGETGEILVRGPAVTPGYWRQSRDGFFTDDWFHTGDAGRLDAAGQLYIVGRVKEVYRSGGENVYPAEVEAVLAELPGIRELAVLGIPDEKWGETGLLAIVPEPGVTISLEEVRAFAAGRLAKFKLPSDLIALEVLPRSAMDKISRPAIRATWQQRQRANGLETKDGLASWPQGVSAPTP
jgi:fatty-acyl-CoA synthase